MILRLAGGRVQSPGEDLHLGQRMLRGIVHHTVILDLVEPRRQFHDIHVLSVGSMLTAAALRKR
jgi:hypothetical protein